MTECAKYARCAVAVLGLLFGLWAVAEEKDSLEPAADAQAEAEVEEEQVDDDALRVPVDVEARPIDPQPGRASYGEETIAAAPTGEGHLADLLRLNPAVDFAREGALSANTAVMRPGEISFHGEPFYQNLFLIDGTDTVNDLNPGAANDIWHTPSLFQPHGGSSPQGYYVDVDLLENVQVYDSNVPAEHGGFTGGVVAAELKRYDGDDGFTLRYGLKRDEWESFHVDADETGEPDIGGADYYTARYTPDYFKPTIGLAMTRGIGGVGVTLSASRRYSRFAQEYEKRYHFARREVQRIQYEDVVDNVLGRVVDTWGVNDVGLSLRFARRRHDGLTSTTYDGAFAKTHDGYGVTADWTRPVADGELQLRIGFDRLGDSLDSDSDMFTFHEFAENSDRYSQYEGAYGDSAQAQTRLSIKPQWTSTAGGDGVQHTLKIGGELRRSQSFYERPRDVVFHQYACLRDNGRNGCHDMDGDGVSSAGDEYLWRVSTYYAGKVDLDYSEAAFYLGDQIRVGRWQFNLEARADRNSFLGNLDVAPRLSAEWDVRGNDGARLIAGLNRYYGRSFFRYQLNDAIWGWRHQLQYNADGSVRRELTYDNRSGAADLKTPYSDEWMLGWTQAFELVTTRLQLVNRAGKDGVSRVLVNCDRNPRHAARYDCDDSDGAPDDGKYFYTNEGRHSTRSATLHVASGRSLNLGPLETTFELALSMKDSQSNRQNDDAYDARIDEDRVYYKGDLVALADLPPWDYNIPFGMRLLTVTRMPAWNLTWSTFVNLRRGGTIARDSGDDCDDADVDYCDGEYDIYEDFDFDNLWTLDAKLVWRPTFFERLNGGLKLTVSNLLDDTVDTNSSRFGSRRSYTSGRLFFAELELRF